MTGGFMQAEITSEIPTPIRESFKKHLVFSMNHERYSTPLSKVIEIVAMRNITILPHAPRYVKGLINLRGKIITLVDFGKIVKNNTQTKNIECSSIIIAKCNDLTIGFMVDEVLSVESFVDNKINTDLDEHTLRKNITVSGIVKNDKTDVLTIIVDFAKLVEGNELKYAL